MKLKIKDLRSKFLLVFSLFTVVFSDIVLGIPYQYIRTKTAATDTDPESTTLEDGISDMTIEAKWRFFEKEGFSFALKPALFYQQATVKEDLEQEGLHTACF